MRTTAWSDRCPICHADDQQLVDVDRDAWLDGNGPDAARLPASAADPRALAVSRSTLSPSGLSWLASGR